MYEQQLLLQQQKQQKALAEAHWRQEEERRRKAEEEEKQRKFHEQRERLRLMGTHKAGTGVNLDQFYSKSSSFLTSSGSKSSPQLPPAQPKPSE